MPREAKFSPPFHEVRPEMVPPHSFCQIRLPIRWASPGEISIAACNATLTRTIITRISAPRPATAATADLDGCGFLSSVPDFISRRSRRLLTMKNLVIGITLATLATSVLAENRPALKDTKDKVSYSIGLDIGTTFKKHERKSSNGHKRSSGKEHQGR